MKDEPRTQFMNALELKIPPVAVALCTALLMWGVAGFLPVGEVQLPARIFFALTCAAAGVVTSGLGVVAFRRARTTVNPTKPGATSSLVLTGVYSLTRNPMYLGFLLILCGWAILLGNAFVFPFLPVFVLSMNRFQIQPEERALTESFGGIFTGYTAGVRRWI
jgi:protein-S-isoprenylcysteine O-methyltransferase Ste14